MNRDEIETILKERGWSKQLSAPEHLIDWQRSIPYNRLIIYPGDLKFITKEVLEALMHETNLSLHGEILLMAREEYEKKQTTLAGTTVAENGMVKQVMEMRNRLKKVIDDFPVGKLGTLADLIIDLYEAEKAKPKQVETEAAKEWKERAEVVGEEGVKVAVIEMATVKDADVAEQAFIALQEDRKVYKSAVILNETTVRTVEFEKSTKGTTVVVFNAAGNESALGMRMLFDWTLMKEAIIVRVTRTERKLSVSYITTGVKRKPVKAPRHFTLKDTDGYELVDKETGEPIWEKEKRGERGEGGETPYLVKRRRV